MGGRGVLDRARFYHARRLFWWQRRRPVAEFDTRIYLGRPGAGKTLFATRDAVLLLRQGIRVAANYKVRDPLTGREAERIGSWLDFLRMSVEAIVRRQPMVFVIDEINLWAPARFYQKVPAWWLTLMSQRRHFGVGIIATAQNFEGVEVYLRRLVNSVVFLKAVPVSLPIYERGAGVCMVRLPAFFAAAVDPQDAENALAVTTDAQGARQRSRLPLGAFVWMPAWVYGAYSTEEIVAVEEWREDEDVEREVAEQLQEAIARKGRVYIPAADEDWRRIEQDLEICRDCSRLVGCDRISDVVVGLGCPMIDAQAREIASAGFLVS